MLAGLPDAPKPPSETDSSLEMDLGEALSYVLADSSGVLMRTRSPTGGFGSTGGLTGLVMLSSIAIPNMHMARIGSNEASAVALLRGIRVAQETYRANHVRDEDGDGEGEYGFLVDLLGLRRPGDTRVLSGRRYVSGEFSRVRGDFLSNGYYFRAYLPSEDGSPIGEHELASRIDEADGDLAENIMVVVAWPEKKGTSGNRAFILDMRGTIYSCGNGPYGGRRNPPPDLMFSQEGNLASRPLRRAATPRDGCKWAIERD
jgi:hypothetical protein